MNPQVEQSLMRLDRFFATNPRIGGITKVVDIEMAVDTSAYADGDVIQGLKSITDAVIAKNGSGIIQSVEIVDADGSGATIDVHFFTDSITVAADNAAWAPTFADLQKMVPGGPVSISSYNTYNSLDTGSVKDLAIPYQVGDTEETLYMLLIARGSKTWSAAGNLHVRLGLLID